ncbi:hypothetical protein [Baaleninema simplex]|uniref:hypothetical protein n=1 Tax=Baaleninema simplex TaxID=2862350 RepID=UPI0011819150|nr:hypothetical protein [Baaleninema simplex]
METSSERPESRREAIERKNMDDMLLTLEHLFEREESTAKIVLDCLYNMGSENLIYRKVCFRPLRIALRPFAKLSKPVFLFFGLRWFKANCPWLIADWLQSLVEFDGQTNPEDTELQQIQTPELNELPPPDYVLKAERSDREIERLNAQVRLLTSSLVVTVAILGSMLAWLGYELHVTRSLDSDPPIATQDRQQEFPF